MTNENAIVALGAALTHNLDPNDPADQLLRDGDFWRTLTEALPQLVWAAGPDGACQYYSTQWTEYTGAKESEILGWEWMQLMHPDDKETMLQVWAGAVDGRRPYDVEFRIRSRDGVYGWFKTRGTPKCDSNGNIVRWFGTCTDITNQKRAEEALKRSEQELLEARTDLEAKVADRTAERMRAQEALRTAQAELAYVTRISTIGEMAASIAHEINQPLTAVVANGSACLRWLAADPPNMAEARLAVERIIKDGNRAGDVIRRVRALVKHSPPQMERLDVNEIIREVVGLAHSEAQRYRVSLKAQLSEELPLVLGDRVQLQQVMLNLIINGLESMNDVSAESRELMVRSSNVSGQVVVEVRDCGTGLEEEHLSKIFEAFYTTKPSGMGMGLAICRSIVTAHGGKIWAQPNSAQGAVFLFSLPVDDEDAIYPDTA